MFLATYWYYLPMNQSLFSDKQLLEIEKQNRKE
jgi:hypothetical protein